MSKKIKKLKKRKTSTVSTEVQEKFNTAVHLCQTGLLGQAHSVLGEIIEKNPNHLDSYKLLVDTALQTGKANSALSILKRTVKQNQHNSVCRGYLADLLSHLGFYNEATTHYEAEISLTGKNRPTGFDTLLLNAAIAYSNSGEALKAIDKLKQAARVNEKNTEAYYLLASTYQSIGDMAKAKEYAKKCLEIEPLHPKCLYILSILDVGFFSQPLAREMVEKAEAPEIGIEDKIYLSFALYLIFEASNDFDKAFKYLKTGNDLKNKTTPYNFAGQANYFRKTRKIFTRFLELSPPPPPKSLTPIFIVGMPRSGTTLVEQIIASHREVEAGGEIIAMSQIAHSIINNFFSSRDQVKNQPLNPAKLKKYQEIYLANVTGLISGNTNFVTDKMPQNFFFLGLIKSILPNARIIHCKRNPVATTFSCYKTLFTARGQEFSNNLSDLANFYRLYQETISHWQALMPESILSVNYEDIVADQTTQTGKILEFCGLEWDDNCLNFHKTERVVSTASVMQVRKPIYKSSLAKWKRYEAHLGPLLDLVNNSEDNR